MLRLHAVQAQFGDCLIVEYGTSAGAKFIVIDGGPRDTFERHLEPELASIAALGGRLEAVILSHVDADHVTGLLDFVAQLRQEKADGAQPLIDVGALWHNSFSATVGAGTDIEPRLATLLAQAAAANQVMDYGGVVLAGIREGDQLRRAANALRLPINPGFPGDLVLVDTAPSPIALDNIKVHVVGPTQANLDALKEEWLKWLETHEQAVADNDVRVLAMADRSVPNLSSIMLLVEGDGRRMLLTGDGRGDHLLDGLRAAGLLDDQGGIHVDLLKAPHHGSDRNVTKKFFETITADTYVISADGTYDNPDYATLTWIVEAAADASRQIEIVITNETPSTKKLRKSHKPAKYGYTFRVLDSGAHQVAVELSN